MRDMLESAPTLALNGLRGPETLRPNLETGFDDTEPLSGDPGILKATLRFAKSLF